MIVGALVSLPSWIENSPSEQFVWCSISIFTSSSLTDYKQTDMLQFLLIAISGLLTLAYY